MDPKKNPTSLSAANSTPVQTSKLSGSGGTPAVTSGANKTGLKKPIATNTSTPSTQQHLIPPSTPTSMSNTTTPVQPEKARSKSNPPPSLLKTPKTVTPVPSDKVIQTPTTTTTTTTTSTNTASKSNLLQTNNRRLSGTFTSTSSASSNREALLKNNEIFSSISSTPLLEERYSSNTMNRFNDISINNKLDIDFIPTPETPQPISLSTESTPIISGNSAFSSHNPKAFTLDASITDPIPLQHLQNGVGTHSAFDGYSSTSSYIHNYQSFQSTQPTMPIHQQLPQPTPQPLTQSSLLTNTSNSTFSPSLSSTFNQSNSYNLPISSSPSSNSSNSSPTLGNSGSSLLLSSSGNTSNIGNQRSLSPVPSSSSSTSSSSASGRRTPNTTLQPFENVQAVCRFRTLLPAEASKALIGEPLNDKTKLLIKDSQTVNYVHLQDRDKFETFKFSKVFLSDTDQEHFFQDTMPPLIEHFMNGFNVTSIAYGQNGSGKTYTMLGNANLAALSRLESDERWGLIPRTMRDIFSRIQSSTPRFKYQLKLSIVEIHVEKLLDLLDPSQEPLKSENSLNEISSHQVSSLQDVFQLFDRIEEIKSQRQQDQVKQNQLPPISSSNDSSYLPRSHFGFIVNLIREDLHEKIQGKGILNSTLFMFDLASSDSTDGLNQNQTKDISSINLSILFLRKMIKEISSMKQQMTPKGTRAMYRDTLLTKIMTPMFGGNSLTLVIINCSSNTSESAIRESMESLEFGKSVQCIKNKPAVNYEMTPQQMKSMVAQLSLEKSRLEIILNSISPETPAQFLLDLESSNESMRREETSLREKISYKEATITRQIKFIDDYTRMIEEKNQLLEDNQGILDMKERTIENQTTQIKEYKYKIELMENQIRELSVQLEEYKEKNDQLHEQITDQSKSHDQLNELLEQLDERDKKILNFERDIKLLTRQKDDLEKSLKSNGQLSEKSTLETNSQITSLREQIQSMETDYKRLEFSYSEMESKYTLVKDSQLKLKEYESRSKEIELKSKEMESKSKEVESKSKELELKSKDFEFKSKELESENKELKENIKMITETHEELKRKTNDDKLKYKKKVEGLKKQQQESPSNPNSDQLKLKESENLSLKSMNQKQDLKIKNMESVIKNLEIQLKENQIVNSGNNPDQSNNTTHDNTIGTTSTNDQKRSNLPVIILSSIFFMILMFIFMLVVGDYLRNDPCPKYDYTNKIGNGNGFFRPT